jgi:hypothetical protein
LVYFLVQCSNYANPCALTVDFFNTNVHDSSLNKFNASIELTRGPTLAKMLLSRKLQRMRNEDVLWDR